MAFEHFLTAGRKALLGVAEEYQSTLPKSALQRWKLLTDMNTAMRAGQPADQAFFRRTGVHALKNEPLNFWGRLKAIFHLGKISKGKGQSVQGDALQRLKSLVTTTRTVTSTIRDVNAIMREIAVKDFDGAMAQSLKESRPLDIHNRVIQEAEERWEKELLANRGIQLKTLTPDGIIAEHQALNKQKLGALVTAKEAQEGAALSNEAKAEAMTHYEIDHYAQRQDADNILPRLQKLRAAETPDTTVISNLEDAYKTFWSAQLQQQALFKEAQQRAYTLVREVNPTTQIEAQALLKQVDAYEPELGLRVNGIDGKVLWMADQGVNIEQLTPTQFKNLSSYIKEIEEAAPSHSPVPRTEQELRQRFAEEIKAERTYGQKTSLWEAGTARIKSLDHELQTKLSKGTVLDSTQPDTDIMKTIQERLEWERVRGSFNGTKNDEATVLRQYLSDSQGFTPSTPTEELIEAHNAASTMIKTLQNKGTLPEHDIQLLLAEARRDSADTHLWLRDQQNQLKVRQFKTQEEARDFVNAKLYNITPEQFEQLPVTARQELLQAYMKREGWSLTTNINVIMGRQKAIAHSPLEDSILNKLLEHFKSQREAHAGG